jgi:phenylpropionate dioxygenase-like ring-hydroxylating dioxygenase large terminal subunit
MGDRLVFWRDRDGHVVCLRDRCVHRGVALSRGRVMPDGELECPFHGFRYDAAGRVTRIPANGRAAPVPERFAGHAYPTHEAHGFIWIWWGEAPPAPLAPPRYFDDLDDSFTFAEVIDPWATHYSRGVENQLDVAHLPFVHHSTIGRGGQTLVDGPVVQWEGEDRFVFYVYNRVDDGTLPRRPEEISPDPARDFHLGFIFPNLWQNSIGNDTRVVAAFVPVDDGHMLLYVRFYQRIVRVPVLRDLVARLAMPFNMVIVRQDRRVVETQRPKRVALQSGEQLIQADRPIVAYRKRRAELLAEAGVSDE